MSDQLKHYNGALRLLGEGRLVSLSEDRGPRHDLDAVWDDGFIDYVLAQGSWNFGIRSSNIGYEPSLEPSFGLSNVFEKPSDLVLLTAISGDGHFTSPLMSYRDEAGHWYADVQAIYVSYVSNHVDFGGTPATWPQTFSRYVDAELALAVCEVVTQSTATYERVERERNRRLSRAKAKDAMAEAPKFLAHGSWVSARTGGFSASRNR